MTDYIAVKPCGCATRWIAGDETPEKIGDFVARAVKDGMTVEPCTTEAARKRLHRCTCGKP